MYPFTMTLDKGVSTSPIQLRIDPSSGVPTYLQLVQQVERALRLGFLQPGDQLEKIAGLLDQLSLVALAFPAFSDGRSFSKGELLRSRYYFEGAVRATGQVLVDQLPHMLRLGFDEFEVSHPVLLKRLEEGRTGGLGLYYQPTAKPEPNGPKYSWRRTRAG